jgi:hypothetical protein
MTKYLLLRDNKQSGPYELDELRTKGLKAYDLVWIDGKSAAWRYPSEVDELKSFAPAVEEQPFDRFYKRPAQNPISSPAPATIGEPSAVPGKRIIYVTLPSPASREPHHHIPASSGLIAVQQADRTQSSNSFQPYPSSQAQSPLPSQGSERPLPQPLAQLPPNPPPTTTEPLHPSSGRVYSSFRPVEENNSQDPADMWKTTVEMPPRPAKTSLKKAMQSVMVLLCILALLAAGIFIGLSMNRDSFGFSPKFAAKDPSVSSEPPILRADHPSSSMPVYNTSVPITRDSSARRQNARNGPFGASPSLVVSSSVGQTTPGDGTASSALRKKNITLKEKSSPAIQKVTASVPDKDSAASSFTVLHREAVHRTDPATIDKDLVKNNIASLVSAGAGKYTVGTFGGISDVQITVSNRSIYPLDLVVVEVRYVQANKKVFKTENLYFRGVSAGAALMQEAPKSSRGIKIEYKITLINSKELGLSYSGI